MPPSGHRVQMARLAAQGAGHLGNGSGGATTDAYVPRLVNLEYLPGEDPDLFLKPGWAGGTPKAHAFHESPGGFAKHFSDDDGGVQTNIPGASLRNPELQENQAAVVVGGPRAVVLVVALRSSWAEPMVR